MKVHKKILTHFLSSTSPVDKEGYLYKRKKRSSIYHRRWFVLKANLLFYQERPADRHLLGVIVLEGCAVRCTEADVQFSFSVVFQGPEAKTYRFAAVDLQSQESWMKTLLSAGHGYLALLLRDLRGQYEEAQQHRCSDWCVTVSAAAPTPEQGPTAAVAKARSQSASTLLPAPTRAISQKCPTWLRRNALITPLNGPATRVGEWPLVDLDPLQDFQRLHDYYGQQVKEAREEWRKSQGKEEQRGEGEVTDLG
ncbi:unnamed protein product [Tetraodon nigroviridis]|uniref:Sesquipedalian n=1 Tax=Tetraodon nigroviridis TaxID=99883 RepID=Q4RWL0_TETNG|nr:unnamed protein product [Tetraodon nigroviridis]